MFPKQKNFQYNVNLTDSLDAFHTDEFKADVKSLFKSSSVMMPRYDIATNTRMSKDKLVKSSKVNVFEGLHTIHLLGELDNSVTFFLDTDIETCLERRIARDTSKYGIPEARIRTYWYECVIPMCEEWILPQKYYADFILN